MRDDVLNPTWTTHHSRASTAIHALFATIGHGFARLNAKQYDAPWKTPDVGQA